jgi:hypothetical protein
MLALFHISQAVTQKLLYQESSVSRLTQADLILGGNKHATRYAVVVWQLLQVLPRKGLHIPRNE